ncbi:DUF6497 family protein [Paracoccus sp. (in: a-proteobacteria)]|uniref:DUF6497 family protein n=1 Tax=Paracoccus sp. TaxID=267 RepID=UPI00322045E4
MSRLAALRAMPLVLAALAWAGCAAGSAAGAAIEIDLPSGARVEWQETLHDNSGGMGLTYRFRFVMRDLASRVPATEGPASDFETGERGPIDIDTESGEISGEDAPEVLVEPAPPQPPGDDAGDPDEEEADALLGEVVLPAEPDLLAQDPIHADIVWLCENWVLPRIASPAPRPSQIIISIADRPLAFGTQDPAALQLFEAFRLPPDRDACEWEPW